MAEKRIMKLATRGKRFAAGIIDSAPLAVVYLSIMGVALSAFAALVQGVMDGLVTDGSSGYYDSHPYVHSESFFHPSIFLILILAYVGLELYFFSRSQTIGKAILGLQVVDAKTGRPIGFAKMLLREVIVKKASSSILYLGYIWILIDKYNRSWHDKILDTYVIDQRPEKTHVEYVAAETASSDDDVKASAPEATHMQENPVHEVKTEDSPEENVEVINTEEREFISADATDSENPEMLNPRAQLLQSLEKNSDQE